MKLTPSTLAPAKWLLAPVVVLSLTACGGGATDGNSETGTEETAAGSYVEVTDQQGSIEEFVGASEDAEVERCETGNGGWISEGTVTNPTEDAQSYRLYVAFNENRDTEGLVQVDIESVAAGATESWQVEAPIDGEDLDCVIRVERFAPQG
ncbi:MAG: hypothetical protein ACTHXA_05810 [Gulosibacter sp.]|uniref:hypothetical protein n=1 Tax=Gulosibacter sp. TaxID=2817531 RepID=UPI003F8DA185